MQLLDAEKETEASSEHDPSKTPDTKAHESQTAHSDETKDAPSVEEKNAEAQENHVPSKAGQSAGTPIKETRDSELKARERAESSPKTLRELSKEITEISDAVNIVGAQVDEGIDMKGNKITPLED